MGVSQQSDFIISFCLVLFVLFSKRLLSYMKKRKCSFLSLTGRGGAVGVEGCVGVCGGGGGGGGELY